MKYHLFTLLPQEFSDDSWMVYRKISIHKGFRLDILRNEWNTVFNVTNNR